MSAVSTGPGLKEPWENNFMELIDREFPLVGK